MEEEQQVDGDIFSMDKINVTVLMSTYNGEDYIREQIDSILAQKKVDIHLVIRDDGSEDSTTQIIKEYIQKRNNITLINDINIGACKSFLTLMSMKHKTLFIALADQDDIWDSDKLISAINIMRRNRDNIPLLYHSNLRIVDSDNNFIRNAHRKIQVPKYKYSFLAEALPTGCTIVYNHALEKYINKIQPETFSMHDSWIYCIASLYGKVIYDFEPHINYRQHGNNTVGTSKKKLSLDTIKQEKRRISSKIEPRYTNAIELDKELHESLSEEADEKIRKIVRYKKSMRNTIDLLLDREIKPSTLYRRLRFDMMILRRKI